MHSPDLLGPEVQKVLGTLEPGKFSPVIKTAWGCCIVKRKKLTDEDILSVVKEQAKNSAEDQMYQELDAWRKRAKIQRPRFKSSGILFPSWTAPLDEGEAKEAKGTGAYSWRI